MHSKSFHLCVFSYEGNIYCPFYLLQVGRPIPVEKNKKPTAEDLDVFHQRYMDELTLLFEEHKGNYGVPEDAHLLFQ